MVVVARVYERIKTIFLIDAKLSKVLISAILDILFSEGCSYNKLVLGSAGDFKFSKKNRKEHEEKKEGEGNLEKAIDAIKDEGRITLGRVFCKNVVVEVSICFFKNKENNGTTIFISISERLHIYEHPEIWDEFKDFADRVFKKISEKYVCKDITKEKTKGLRAVTSVFYENIK